jgi:hypothetical protein
MRIQAVLTAAVICGGGALCAAQDAPMRDSIPASDTTAPVVASRPARTPPFRVTIERVTVGDMQAHDTLDIMIESDSGQFAGGSLKIACNSPYLDIIEVLKGEVPQECGWEYFSAYRVNTLNREDLPRCLWQITTLSKMSADTVKAKCTGLNRAASIARLVVSSARHAQTPDTTAAVVFFWQDCRDNVLSDVTGSVLMVSERIIDYFPAEMTSQKDIFPTRLGTPRQCIDRRATNPPQRVIEFHNGGVEFKLDIGIPAVDSAGEGAAN